MHTSEISQAANACTERFMRQTMPGTRLTAHGDIQGAREPLQPCQGHNAEAEQQPGLISASFFMQQ